MNSLPSFRALFVPVATVDIDKDKVVYSREDVYFTIVDVLGYINERTPGRFKIDQSSFQNYIIHYVPDGTLKKKGTEGNNPRLGTHSDTS